MSVLDALWIEKYRPTSINDVILPESFKNNVYKWLKNRDIPHLLLYGPPGSGKTTVSKIIVDKLTDEQDRLIINGSYYRGISEVKEQIMPFVRQQPISCNSSLRIVFIDEADSITGDAWKSLRHIIEAYCKYSRFILTCNYVNKIPTPIQSRCQSFEFKELDKDACFNILQSILTIENISFNDNDVKLIVDKLHPDLRKMINTLQSLSSNNVLNVTNLHQALPSEDKILNIISDFINHKIDRRLCLKEIENIIKTKWVDYTSLYPRIFDLIPMNMLNLKVLTNKYAYQHNNVISQDMNFLSFIIELTNVNNRMM